MRIGGNGFIDRLLMMAFALIIGRHAEVRGIWIGITVRSAERAARGFQAVHNTGPAELPTCKIVIVQRMMGK